MSEISDEINFKPYLLALKKGWWIILLLFIIGAGATYLYLSMQPPEYLSTASILLTRTRSNLSLSSDFQTFNENVSDSRSRMDAIVAIAQSDSVVHETLTTLKSKLPPNAQTIQGLKSHVQIKSQGDLIFVNAVTEEPNLSFQLANTWAENAVKTINLAYGGEQSLDAVEGMLGDAEKEYQNAQTALEAFISENHIALIENNLSQALVLLKLIQLQETSRIENVATSQFEGIRLLLTDYYQTISEMDQVISQVKSFKQKLQTSQTLASAADDLAILLASAKAYGLTDYTDLQLNLADITSLSASPDEYISDLDILVQQAEVQKALAKENIQQIAQTVIPAGNQSSATQGDSLEPIAQEIQSQIESLSQINQLTDIPAGESTGNNALIQQTAYQIQQLNAQLEKEKATLETLTTKRDVAWEAFQALLRKATELKNSSGTNNNVSLASEAVIRQRPVSQNTVRSAIVVGLLAAILGAIILIAWQWYKHPENIDEVENSAKT